MKAIQTAYGARAREYTLKLGCVDQMEPCDAALIRSWGARTGGRILDAGCGPGHWTDLLSNEAPKVIGIDVVPEFIRSARQRYPGVQFETMDMERACFPDGSFAGILAWYSMIHCEQASVEAKLKQFKRLIRAEGSLLLGFFTGPAWHQFPHAIATAFYWDVEETCNSLSDLGFRVDEVHTRSSQHHRDHAAIVARRGCADGGLDQH